MAPPPVPTGNAYDKYATRNPIERRLVAGFLATLDAMLPTGTPPRRVLEVGTGEGHVAERVQARYPDAFVTGLDLPDEALAADWKARGLPAVFGSGEHLPYPDGTFDLVLAVEVLEHVPDPPTVLREIARVAAGPVVLTVPWEPWWRAANIARGKYVKQLGNTPGHVQHWSGRAFRSLVAAHLDVTSSARSFPWLLVAARPR